MAPQLLLPLPSDIIIAVTLLVGRSFFLKKKILGDKRKATRPTIYSIKINQPNPCVLQSLHLIYPLFISPYSKCTITWPLQGQLFLSIKQNSLLCSFLFSSPLLFWRTELDSDLSLFYFRI